jgi:DNA-directed RNA polymerase subunit K/omega
VTDSLPTSLQDAVAGSFHKTALLQKRVRELIKGAIPLIETREKNPIRIAYLEMQQGLIELMPEEETNAGAPLPMGTPLE